MDKTRTDTTSQPSKTSKYDAAQDRHAWINRFTQLGVVCLHLFGKVPRDTAWQLTKYDPTVSSEDFGNTYGISLPAEVVVVDVDPRNFAKDINSLERLYEACGGEEAFDTFTVQTGGGGWHFYFRKPAEVKLRLKHDYFRGVEFKSRVGQVVGPGSVHPETNRPYRVTHGSWEEMREFPSVLLEMLTTTQDADFGSATGLEGYRDDDHNQQRYIDFLKRCPEAVQGCLGNWTTLKTCYIGRDMGLSPQVTLDLMLKHYNDRCMPPWSADNLKTIVKNAYKYGKKKMGNLHPEAEFATEIYNTEDEAEAQTKAGIRWQVNKDGTIKKNLEMTVNWLITPDYKTYENPVYNVFRRNLLTGRIEYSYPAPWHFDTSIRREWGDDEAIHLAFYLSRQKNFVVDDNLCRKAATVVADKNHYHPVQEYLKSRVWDGTKRLETLFIDYCGSEDNSYTREVAKAFFVGAVKRVFEPGCQFDTMLILEGPQGTGKTTFCRVMGGDWYGDVVIDPRNKDTFESLKEFWIVEASEMEYNRRHDVAAIKSFLTKTKETYRPAYGRVVTTMHKQYVMIGTINPDGDGAYLRDATGNRRFLPIETHEINTEQLREDRDQLWAEAYMLYKMGHKTFIQVQEAVNIAKSEQEARYTMDPWENEIKKWLAVTGTLRITGEDIVKGALGKPPHAITRSDLMRLSNIMTKRLGWTKTKYWIPELKISVWGYISPLDIISDL